MMNFDTNYDEKQDTKLEILGVQVVVDKKSSLYLEGTTIDYYESLEKKGFKLFGIYRIIAGIVIIIIYCTSDALHTV